MKLDIRFFFLQHVWVRDTRDDRVIPNEGYMVRVQQEVAGVGGDVNHLKHEVELQVNKSLFLGTVGGVLDWSLVWEGEHVIEAWYGTGTCDWGLVSLVEQLIETWHNSWNYWLEFNSVGYR